MFSKRLLTRVPHASSTTSAKIIRPFSSTSCSQRSPSLSDIQPGHVAEFDSRQQKFREELAERTKKQREAERASYHRDSSAFKSTTAPAESSSTTSASDSPLSNVPSSTDTVPSNFAQTINHGLGSLSTALTGESARKSDDASSPARKQGRFSSLIYGTEEGREMDRDIERSFSQVLARGKYVHSIVFHEVKPGHVDEYVELVGGWYPRVASMPENKVHLVGSWRTEVGDCDTFVHIWEYQRYEGYHESLHAIQHHPEFAGFDAKLKTLINSKNTSLMQEFRFWPTSPPRQLGGVFELRSYTLHPGNLLEWETHWQKGLAARREVMEGVGAWFVQIGELNMVHHLWQFADLEERRARREQSWSVPGWGETVHRTVPLIQTMKSRIMVPMPWSPIA